MGIRDRKRRVLVDVADAFFTNLERFASGAGKTERAVTRLAKSVLLGAGVCKKSAWAALRLYRRRCEKSAHAIPVAEGRRGRKVGGGFRSRARAALLPYTMPTCRWSYQQQAPLQTLTGSVAAIHRTAR